MDNITLQRMSVPVITGTPRLSPQGTRQEALRQNTPSFEDILKRKLENGSGEITFSKHAATRIQQRGIDMSEQNVARLHEGVRLAQGKGLGDTLILVDSTAFIVNAKNGTVITTVDSKNLSGNVFTNIEGTVVI